MLSGLPLLSQSASKAGFDILLIKGEQTRSIYLLNLCLKINCFGGDIKVFELAKDQFHHS